MRDHRLVVIGTVNAKGEPESALVGIAVTDACELIFDTSSKSRKHANLVLRPRAAVTFSGPGERTVQYEGMASPLSTTGSADASYRDVYYRAWPEGRDRLSWPDLVYWRLTPLWARYACYEDGSTVEEFHW
jgi:pyridoxine/pyridoxamine 5'-phosphate oxidase